MQLYMHNILQTLLVPLNAYHNDVLAIIIALIPLNANDNLVIIVDLVLNVLVRFN